MRGIDINPIETRPPIQMKLFSYYDAMANVREQRNTLLHSKESTENACWAIQTRQTNFEKLEKFLTRYYLENLLWLFGTKYGTINFIWC